MSFFEHFRPSRGSFLFLTFFLLLLTQVTPNDFESIESFPSFADEISSSPNGSGNDNQQLISELLKEGASARADCAGVIKFSFKCSLVGVTYPDGDGGSCKCVSFLSACCTSSKPTTEQPTTSTPGGRLHPLDPLTSNEIMKSSQIITSYWQARGRASSSLRFQWITLKEPPKAELLPYFLQDRIPPPGVRRSFSLLIERGTGRVFEAIVNLNTGKVESFTEIFNVESPISPDDMKLAEQIGRSNATVQARCAALGWTNMDLVNADPWSIGYIGDRPEYLGKRVVQLYLFGKNFPEDNQYAHPFDFIAVVDLDQEAVIAIEELPTHDDFDASNKNGNVVPKAEANYDYKLRGGNSFLRQDDKPIIVESPEGASYKMTGNQVEWQKWKLRLGFNGREGLIMYTCSYKDGSTVRPIFYRTSLTEMFIPYGDPRPPYHRKAVFDLGQYGIGFNAVEQRSGQDVIGANTIISAILNNSTGHPVFFKGVTSVREEDSGILWKHVDFRTGEGVVVRSHRLVVSFIATVGNYDYVFSWMFYQDGSIQFEVRLTGELSVNMMAKGSTPGGWGTEVASQIDGAYHQHFFAVRMDTEIDGNGNSVFMSDAVSVPYPTGSPENPYGQGFTTERTYLKTAAEGRTKISPLSGRVWVVNNPNNVHPFSGNPIGWKLMPMNTPPLLMREDSPLRPKVGFLDYDVWVIPYAEDQIFPGGFYLNNSGLPVWVGDNPSASLENKDLVLFHNFGLVHIPRVEDYPVMPVELAGFWFKPYNFFVENPAIDVPPPRKRGSKIDEL